ncbi:hypothetical protein EDB89DRAFT_264428 [Lactarius sanguifluus]|nr:hypothetical protein EDB89DRAFT_264428 [Lactarius sanguifluus]
MYQHNACNSPCPARVQPPRSRFCVVLSGAGPPSRTSLHTSTRHVSSSFSSPRTMFTFTPTSITPEHKRIFLIAAAAAAAIALTVVAVRSSSSSTTDKALSKRQLARLSPDERRALVKTLRQRAEAATQADDYERAVELYTRALAAADADQSVVAALHTSRAWCYANMRPPRHREVVRDCDAALALDPLDAMAVLRRSIALQELKAMGER